MASTTLQRRRPVPRQKTDATDRRTDGQTDKIRYKRHLSWEQKLEEGPVYGPTLPLEAENPNVVIWGYLRKSPVFRYLQPQPFFLYLSDQPCAHCAGKVAPGLLSLSISNSMQHISQTAF